jgi:Fe2+ transport system protein FeoA
MKSRKSTEAVPTTPEPVELTRLRAGDRGTFHGADLPRKDAALLEALGLTDTCPLRVCQVGDPWIVQVRATRIGVAQSVAKAIFVVPESCP